MQRDFADRLHKPFGEGEVRARPRGPVPLVGFGQCSVIIRTFSEPAATVKDIP